MRHCASDKNTKMNQTPFGGIFTDTRSFCCSFFYSPGSWIYKWMEEKGKTEKKGGEKKLGWKMESKGWDYVSWNRSPQWSLEIVAYDRQRTVSERRRRQDAALEPGAALQGCYPGRHFRPPASLAIRRCQSVKRSNSNSSSSSSSFVSIAASRRIKHAKRPWICFLVVSLC